MKGFFKRVHENPPSIFPQLLWKKSAFFKENSEKIRLFQGGYGNAVLALAVNAQTEGSSPAGLRRSMLVDRLAQRAGALAVDNGDGFQLAHDGGCR
jgi:hypothetical protein